MSDYVLTLYEEDDSTVYFAVGTAAAHANPYLQAPETGAEAEIDPKECSARIGRYSVRVVDPQTGATQVERFLTALLGNAAGYSELNGRRAILAHATGEIIVDGICAGARLLPTFAGFELALDDIRARAIKVPVFTRTTTSTVFPRGVLNGYGSLFGVRRLVAPAVPVAGAFQREPGADAGILSITGTRQNAIDNGYFLTAAMREVTHPQWDDDLEANVQKRVEVWWRPTTGGAWNVLADMPDNGYGAPSETDTAWGLFQTYQHPATHDSGAEVISGLSLARTPTVDIPTNLQSVEVLVVYVGAPTEEYPFHWEGTAGTFLRNVLRGDYSFDEDGVAIDPRLRYDEDRFTGASIPSALQTPIRVRITEPVEDLREWFEEACAALGVPPALDELGRISPIGQQLPDESVVLAEINNSNAEPLAGWDHPITGAVTQLDITYPRDFRVPPTEDPTGRESGGDGIGTVEQRVSVKPNDATIQQVAGIHTYKLDGFLFRALGGETGSPISGDTIDETGSRIAYRRGHELIDRFAYGAQSTFRRVRRSDADMAALRVGDWVLDAVSWEPNYATGERGRNHLAQVVAIKDINPAWRELRLVDAAPYANPVGQPTLGTVTVDSAGVVSVPVSAVPTGGEARVDYAVSATEPDTGSGLWTYLDRTDTAETLTSPPLPVGSTVWIRSRGEVEGRRPSAWTNAVSITVPSTPRVLRGEILIDDAGVATVYWETNAATLGVRAYYAIHDIGTDPGTLTDSVDADAADGEVAIPGTVSPGEQVTVELEPWTGWTGSSVTGTAGERMDVTAVEPEIETGPPGPEGPAGPQGPPGEPGDETANVIDLERSGPTGGQYRYVVTLGADVEYAFVHWASFADPVPSNYVSTLLSAYPDEIITATGQVFFVPVPAKGQVIRGIVRPYVGNAVSGKGWEFEIIGTPLEEMAADIAEAQADAAAAITAAAGAQATADGKVTTFFAASPPTAEAVGDLWIETDADNRLHRWSGSNWVLVRDAGIAQAISDAADAQATADGKIVTFYQASAPTAESVGDLWIDTDDGNHPYRWSGSAWVSVRDDGAIDEAVSQAQVLMAPFGAIIRTGTAPTTRPGGTPLEEGDIWVETPADTVYFWDDTSNVWVLQEVDGAQVYGILGAGVIFAGEVTAITGDFDELTVATGGWLRSANYVAGVSGYELTDTSAEFNDVTIRGGGEFRGTVVIDTEGLGNSLEFEYDGTPVAALTTAPSYVSLASPTAQIEVGTQVILSSGQGVVINVTLADLQLIGLPTSNPGGSGLVWNDSGALKIT